MKVTAAVFFAIIIILTTPLCCEGDILLRESFPPYRDVSQQQALHLSEISLEVEWRYLWLMWFFYDVKQQLFSERSLEVELHYLWSKRLSYIFKQQPMSERSLEVEFALMYYIIELLTDDSAKLQQKVVKRLSPYSVASQQQTLSEKSLKVIDSRKWLKGVISDSESRHKQSDVHDRVKKAFEEVTVENRAKAGLALLTSCLTNAVGAALLIISNWKAGCFS